MLNVRETDPKREKKEHSNGKRAETIGKLKKILFMLSF